MRRNVFCQGAAVVTGGLLAAGLMTASATAATSTPREAAARTAPDYRLYALDTTPAKPGMLRVAAGTGVSVELEIWGFRGARRAG